MFRARTKIVAILLLYHLTPGVCELAESVVTVVNTGEATLHVHEDHDAESDLDSTADTDHECTCHHLPGFLVSSDLLDTDLSGPHTRVVDPSDRVPDAVRARLFRPPRA